jgi:hypothetical protein
VRARLALLLAALLALACAPAADSHGQATRLTGYVSTVSNLSPNVLGVFARVLDGDRRLLLRNVSGKTIVILGYGREPYLRFDPHGVWENVASLTAAVNRPGAKTPPPKLNPNARPRWRKVGDGPGFAWHEHRIHTSGEPPVVSRAPDRRHFILYWRIPARANGKPFAIKGFLGYAPAPAAKAEGGVDWWLPAVAATGGVATLAAVLAIALRWWRRRARRPDAGRRARPTSSTE